MKKKSGKKLLYAKYLEEHQNQEEKNVYAQKIGKDSEHIVIQRVSTGGKLIEKLGDAFYLVGKIIITALIIMLISLSVTVLLNGELRETVLSQLLSSL